MNISSQQYDFLLFVRDNPEHTEVELGALKMDYQNTRRMFKSLKDLKCFAICGYSGYDPRYILSQTGIAAIEEYEAKQRAEAREEDALNALKSQVETLQKEFDENKRSAKKDRFHIWANTIAIILTALIAAATFYCQFLKQDKPNSGQEARYSDSQPAE